MSGQLEVLPHIRALIEEHKREISILYSELKLRLPSYLKTITIQQLREAGATVDPDISFPRGAEDRIRKHVCINGKINEVRETFRNQVMEYYANVKKELPNELLKKKVEQLSDDEWNQLGIDIIKFRKTLRYKQI